MKPYHITSNVFNSWVDLESIQMISDLILFTDEQITAYRDLTAGQFSITLAFQEKQKKIEARTALEMGPHLKDEPEYEKRMDLIREERESIRKAYDDLLAAWKAL